MRTVVTALALALVFSCGNQLDPQSGSTSQSASAAAQNSRSQGINARPVNASTKKVGFRLTKWKTIHTNSEDEAQETIGALQKIGCEVDSNTHGDHIDVKYRCSQWKSIELATDQLVNQWSSWCEAKGMETIILNPPAGAGKAALRFHLPTEKLVHLNDEDEAKQIINTLQLIGCQVTTNHHDGHIDATYSCPNEIMIQFPSDGNARAWQEWLDEAGFETHNVN